MTTAKMKKKYASKINAFLKKLSSNKTVDKMSSLRTIYPMDVAVFYWLKNKGYIGLVGDVYKPRKTPISATDVASLVKYLKNIRRKSHVRVKKSHTKLNGSLHPSMNVSNNVKNTKKEYDLVLNVKLVVTSIEYKL
jgi:hypothetical protein